MTGLTKSKALLLISAIFCVGLAGGSVSGYSYAKNKCSRPPQSREMATHMKEKLASRLNLTEEQLQQIGPILDETALEMKAIHQATMERIRTTMKNQNEEIKKFLTPEQATKLDDLEKESRERFGLRYRVIKTNVLHQPITN